MAGLIKDRHPLWKRILTMSSKAKRKAFRTFADYPDVPYRVIVDVGAARGDYAARAAMLFPVTRAVMVEARPNAAQDIRERFRGDPRFSVVEAAISDECGETVFHVNEMKDSSSILNVNRSATEATFGKSFGTVEEIVVKTLTLDALYRDENLQSVDLLKVDIQGAEMRLIAGGGEALGKTRAVLLEVNFERFYDDAPLFHEIEATMTAAGFRLRSLLKPKLDRSGEFLAYANALYLRRDA
jgi:FkbM family methyltransferase